MDEIERKILRHLSVRDTIGMQALQESLWEAAKIPKLETLRRIAPEQAFLRRKQPIQAIEYVGGQQFVRITDKGRGALRGFRERMMEYIASHWIELCTLIFTGVPFFWALWSLLFREP